MVLAVLPMTAVLAVLLVRNASDSLESAARDGLRNAAVQLSNRVDGRFDERRNALRGLARIFAADPGAPREELMRDFGSNFERLQLVDLRGTVLARSDASDLRLGHPSADWFVDATRGQETLEQPGIDDGTLHTVLAQPVRDEDGRVRAVLLGDLDETLFAGFVTAFEQGRTGEAVIRDADGRLLWRTGLGTPGNPAAMAARTAAADRTVEGAAGLALAGRTGTLTYTAADGDEVVGGYAPAKTPGWSIVVRQDTSEAFAAIDEQRNLAILVGLLGSLLVAGLAVLFAQRTTRPVKRLGSAARRVADGDLTARVDPEGPGELRELGGSFNAMVESLGRLVAHLRAASADLSTSATQLSSSSQQLATTTTQQSSSATETSSTMQALATTTQSIAESVSGVESRAKDTRDALVQADADLASSAERTLALAHRANEIGAILGLINEIADRTNLLALNAAIEAARAGEAGAGFSVVADEVRRLAERSKTEAKKIADIVGATQDETNATVMAMESGSKRMRHGLELMEEVADAVSQVRFTTDEQHLATEQVVDAMTAVSSTSRQSAAASQQIAGASTQIARLAAELDRAAAAFRTTVADGAPQDDDAVPSYAPGARDPGPSSATSNGPSGNGSGRPAPAPVERG